MKVDKIFFYGNGHYDYRVNNFRNHEVFTDRHIHREGSETVSDPNGAYSRLYYEAETWGSGRIIRIYDDNYIECSLYGSEYFAHEVIDALKECGFAETEIEIENSI